MSTPAPWTLAIDFGTTTSVGAMRVADRTELVQVDGATAVSSAVFLDPAVGLLTGAEAIERAGGAPDCFEPAPKQRLQDAEVTLGGFAMPSTEVAAAVLERIHYEACNTRGGAPAAVRLTYPAGWTGSPKLGALGLAAVTAGIENVRFAPEAIAAAQYIADTVGVPVGGRIAIFDLGAGSLDCAVVENTWWGLVLVGPPGGLDPLGSAGVEPTTAEVATAAHEFAATIDGSGLTPDQLSGIYLTGETAGLPAVAIAVTQVLGIAPREVPDAGAAVALGAAQANDAVFTTIGSMSPAARQAAAAHNKAAGKAVAAAGAMKPASRGEEEPEGDIWWRDQGMGITAAILVLLLFIWLIAKVVGG